MGGLTLWRRSTKGELPWLEDLREDCCWKSRSDIALLCHRLIIIIINLAYSMRFSLKTSDESVAYSSQGSHSGQLDFCN